MRVPYVQLSAKDVDVGVLRATSSKVVLMRSWKLDLQRISFRVDGSAGVSYQGTVHAKCTRRAYILTEVSRARHQF